MDLAEKSARSAVHQELATVRAVVGGRLTVALGDEVHDARRAASCLLAPRPNDRVIVALPADGDVWVLAVLEREDPDAPHRVSVEGDLELDATGALRMRATDGVEVRTPGALELAARRIGATAIDAALSSEQLSFVGRAITTQADTLKTVASVIDTFAERIAQHTKRSYRFVEELDVTRARDVDTRAERTMSLRGKNAFVAAEQLAKIDGEQVHLG